MTVKLIWAKRELNVKSVFVEGDNLSLHPTLQASSFISFYLYVDIVSDLEFFTPALICGPQLLKFPVWDLEVVLVNDCFVIEQ